ncbi:16499_t:CDS:1, partial [Acaulospora morrowiae]
MTHDPKEVKVKVVPDEPTFQTGKASDVDTHLKGSDVNSSEVEAKSYRGSILEMLDLLMENYNEEEDKDYQLDSEESEDESEPSEDEDSYEDDVDLEELNEIAKSVVDRFDSNEKAKLLVPGITVLRDGKSITSSNNKDDVEELAE